MDASPARILYATEDRGQASVTMLLTVAVLFVVFITMVNLLLFLYARGVIRAAVDEGARAGSFANASTAECELRAAAALDDLLGGPLGDGVSVGCSIAGESMVATADAVLTSPIPGLGTWTFTLQARVRNEPGLP